MSNWLEQLERELDERLAAFLSQNPVQEQLFRQQHQLDRARSLQRQRQHHLQLQRFHLSHPQVILRRLQSGLSSPRDTDTLMDPDTWSM